MPDNDLSALRLWWVDAFGEHNHIGGATATRWFLDPLELGRNDIVLDIGCFLGAALRLAARRYRCQGIGLDPETKFSEMARIRAERENFASQVRFINTTANETGLAESSVNVVLSLDAPYDAAEAWRILKANGRFCLATKTKDSLDDFSTTIETNGFRTERSLDATEEAISALKLIVENFQEEEKPADYIKAAKEELALFQQKKGALRYLRWVGRRR